MEAIVNQVKWLAATADDKVHRQMMDTFRHLLYAIERPEDTSHRLIFGVRSSYRRWRPQKLS